MNAIAMLHDHGLPAIFLVILLGQFGVPLPALPLLLAAGAIAASHPPFGLAALVVAVTASVAGSSATFALGRVYGNTMLALLCRISLSPTKCVGYGRTAFDRFGPSALIFSRFIPGLAVLAPPLAGSARMPAPVFVTFQAMGAFLFALFGLGLGYEFQGAVQGLIAQLEIYGKAVVVALAICVSAWLFFVFMSRRGH